MVGKKRRGNQIDERATQRVKDFLPRPIRAKPNLVDQTDIWAVPEDELGGETDSAQTVETLPFRIRLANRPQASYGPPSILSLLARIRSLCDDGADADSGADGASPTSQLVDALDRPLSINVHLRTRSQRRQLLPAQHVLTRTIDLALNRAFVTWPLLEDTHIATIVLELQDTDRFGNNDIEWDKLALVYALLALGQCHDSQHVESTYRTRSSASTDRRIMKGLNRLQAARALVDPSQCDRSLAALQTVMCMAFFLTSNHAVRVGKRYVEQASKAALKMRLYEASSSQGGHEQRLRRRTWDCLRILEASILPFTGLPRTLPWDARSFASPLSIEHQIPDQDCSDTLLQLFELQTDFFVQLGVEQQMIHSNGIYRVSASVVATAKSTAQKLFRSRRHDLIQNASPDSRAYGLYLAYYHAYIQMTLHYPFLHYLGAQHIQTEDVGWRFALTCAQSASEIAEIANQLEADGLLNERHPLSLPALVFAASALLFVELKGQDHQDLSEMRDMSRQAKVVLEASALRCATAAQCLAALMPLYDKVALHDIEKSFVDFGQMPEL